MFRSHLAFVSLFFAICVPSSHAQFFEPDAVVEGKTIPEWVADNINWDIWLQSKDPALDPFNVHPNELDTIMNDAPRLFHCFPGPGFRVNIACPVR